MTDSSISRKIDIPSSMLPHLEAAILRMRYLYPKCEFRTQSQTVEITSPDLEIAEKSTRDLSYTIYREKIFAETLDLRRTLMEMLRT